VGLIVSLLAGLMARRFGKGATAFVLSMVTLLASLQGLAAPAATTVEGAAYRLIAGPVRRARTLTTVRRVVERGSPRLERWLSALTPADIRAALAEAMS